MAPPMGLSPPPYAAAGGRWGGFGFEPSGFDFGGACADRAGPWVATSDDEPLGISARASRSPLATARRAGGSAGNSSARWGGAVPSWRYIGASEIGGVAAAELAAEQLSSLVSDLHRQLDSDMRTANRRLQQLERSVQDIANRSEKDRFAEGELRERWAEVQGSLTGLVQDNQGMARRIDSLDERLWARTSAVEESARQGIRELQQQLQALERTDRLAEAATEDSQRRSIARQRRVEGSVEALEWRLTKLEDCVQIAGAAASPRDVEERAEAEGRAEDLAGEMASAIDELSARIQDLERRADVDERASSAAADRAAWDLGGFAEPVAALLPAAGDPSAKDEALASHAKRAAALEERVRTQMHELCSIVAAVKVKVDSQTQRHEVLADRFRTAHLPAIEELRAEFAEQHERARRHVDSEIESVQQALDLAFEGFDAEGLAVRIEAIAGRVGSNEAAILQLRREARRLRSALRAVLGLPSPTSTSDGATCGLGGSLDTDLGGSGLCGLFGSCSLASVPEQVGAGVFGDISERLGAVAEQLETLDDVARRVSALEGGGSGSLSARGSREDGRAASRHSAGGVSGGSGSGSREDGRAASVGVRRGSGERRRPQALELSGGSTAAASGARRQPTSGGERGAVREEGAPEAGTPRSPRSRSSGGSSASRDRASEARRRRRGSSGSDNRTGSSGDSGRMSARSGSPRSGSSWA